jgi:hypothetical protein
MAWIPGIGLLSRPDPNRLTKQVRIQTKITAAKYTHIGFFFLYVPTAMEIPM